MVLLVTWEAVEQFLQTELRWLPARTIGDLDAVRCLARRFKVSLRAAAVRLIGRQVADWSLYKTIPAWSDEKRPGGRGRGRGRREIRKGTYGMRASELFVDALKEDVLTRTDVLSYLDVSDADLDTLQRSCNHI